VPFPPVLLLPRALVQEPRPLSPPPNPQLFVDLVGLKAHDGTITNPTRFQDYVLPLIQRIYGKESASIRKDLSRGGTAVLVNKERFLRAAKPFVRHVGAQSLAYIEFHLALATMAREAKTPTKLICFDTLMQMFTILCDEEDRIRRVMVTMRTIVAVQRFTRELINRGKLIIPKESEAPTGPSAKPGGMSLRGMKSLGQSFRIRDKPGGIHDPATRRQARKSFEKMSVPDGVCAPEIGRNAGGCEEPHSNDPELCVPRTLLLLLLLLLPTTSTTGTALPLLLLLAQRRPRHYSYSDSYSHFYSCYYY